MTENDRFNIRAIVIGSISVFITVSFALAVAAYV